MSSSTGADSTQVSRPQNKVKIPLPSLDQLAARLSPLSALSTPSGSLGGNANTTNSNTSSGTRSTRLPPTLLARTSVSMSQSAHSSEISLADSTLANPPSTDDRRSISPVPSSVDSNTEGTSSDAVDAPPNNNSTLTTEHVDQHNKANNNLVMSPASALSPDDTLSPLGGGRPSLSPSSSKPVRGYKNVPSLDDITKRLQKARLLSVDGTDAPPPAPPRTQPSSSQPNSQNRVSVGDAPHPLQHSWTLYHDTKAKQAPHDPSVPYVPPSTDTNVYEANLTMIGEFDTVEDFCRYFNWLKPPSQIECNSNYHLFKSGIKPMWEDPANSGGGKWVLTMKSNPTLLDRSWSWLVFALVGEELDDAGAAAPGSSNPGNNDTDEICGAVVSLRSKVDRIQVWTRSKDVERVNKIGKRLIKLLDVSEKDGIGLDFQFHQDERPTLSKYLSIQPTFPTSGFRNSFTGVPYSGGGMNAYGGGGQPPVNTFGGIPGGAFGAFTPSPPPPSGTGIGVVSGGVPLGLPQGGMGSFGMGNAFGHPNNWRNSMGGGGYRRQ